MTPPIHHVVVVGASLGGLQAATTLRQEGFDGALTIVGAEPHRPYDRPPLSKEVLVGDREPADVALPLPDDLAADWVLGDAATALDLRARTVSLASGATVGYDRLVIATGSRPRRLPGLLPAPPRIHELRTLDDALALRAALAGSPRLVVVGGGFIGVEVASSARRLGVDVAIVTLDPPLAVAGPLVSRTVAAQLADHGVPVHVGRTVQAVRPDALVLDDDTAVPADVVVVAVGAVPATDWLAGSGLDVVDGVTCDASGAAVGGEGVVAAGDAARLPQPLLGGAHLRLEHWTDTVKQAQAAARTALHGSAATGEQRLPSFWSDHFGVRLQAIGLPGLADRFDVLQGSVDDRRYAAAAYRGDQLVGGVTYGLPPRALARVRAQLTRTGDEVAR